MIYLLIFFLLLIFTVAYDFNRLEIGKSLCWVIGFIVLVLLMTFRLKVGGDTFNYIRDFETFPRLNELSSESFIGLKYAPLWILFFSLVKTLGFNFILFQLVHSIFINSVIFWFFKKFSTYKFFAVFFYYIFNYLYFNTEILRESLAICIFLISIPSLLNKKWKSYYSLALVAVLFHYSALILIFIPFLRNLKTTIINYLLMITAVIFLSQFILNLFPPIFRELYNIYVVFQPNLGGYIYTTICFILFPILLLNIYKSHIDEKFVFQPFVFSFFLVSVYTYLSPSIALRFFNYFIPITTIILVGAVGVLIEKKIASTFLVLFIFPCVLLYKSQEYFTDTSSVMYNTKFHIRWYPYTHIFNKESKEQFEIIERREKWVEGYFDRLTTDVKELTL